MGWSSQRTPPWSAGDILTAADMITYVADDLTWLKDHSPSTGSIMAFAGTATPSESYGGKWLRCDGAAVSRTTYSDLFAVVGTAFGNGDGSTTFNVPDLRGRTIVALDNLGGSDAGRLGSPNTLGFADGHESHTLTTAEMPSHNHGVNDPGHYHNVKYGATGVQPSGTNAPRDNDATITGATESKVTGITLDPAGSGGAHNNMQPFMTLAWVIKA